MKVILYQPQIPQNSGNIARTCSVSGTKLALVAPMGFSVNDRWLQRAGLDYWKDLNVEIIEENFEEYLKKAPAQVYFFSSHASKLYSKITYGPSDWLVFGSETTGLPSALFQKYPNNFATIPMQSGARCLNLATSVGIVLYEGLRQLNFSL